MRKYLDLMLVDITTMNGGKNSLRSIMLLVFLGSIAGELFLSPLFGNIGFLMVSAMSVPMIFMSHAKYHSEMMFGLLPVSRRDLVTARFIMCVTLYLAISLVMYIFMEVSLALGIDITGDDIKRMLLSSGSGITFEALCRLLFFVFFAFGMTAVASSLKGYFDDPDSYEALTGVGAKAKKMKPGQMIALILVFVACMTLILVTAGAVPLTAAAAVILQLFVQLFTAANGVLFSLVMIALAAMSALYNYICTLLEYEDKDI